MTSIQKLVTAIEVYQNGAKGNMRTDPVTGDDIVVIPAGSSCVMQGNIGLDRSATSGLGTQLQSVAISYTVSSGSLASVNFSLSRQVTQDGVAVSITSVPLNTASPTPLLTAGDSRPVCAVTTPAFDNQPVGQSVQYIVAVTFTASSACTVKIHDIEAGYIDNLPVIAPSNITVNPSMTANGTTVFSTIGAAVAALRGMVIPTTGTTVSIAGPLSSPAASGVYTETVSTLNILNNSILNLVFTGDTRPIVGCGIAHGKSWNRTGSPGVVGGGTGSVANLSAVGAVLTVTASVGTNPDFVACGVVAGDTVRIQDSATGAIGSYTVQSVASTALTMTAAITQTIGVGSFMVVAPNVVVAPASGTPFTCGTYMTTNGIWFKAPNTSTAACTILTNSVLNAATCYFSDGSNAVRSNGPGNATADSFISAGLFVSNNTGCTFSGTSNTITLSGLCNASVVGSLITTVAATAVNAFTLTVSCEAGIGNSVVMGSLNIANHSHLIIPFALQMITHSGGNDAALIVGGDSDVEISNVDFASPTGDTGPTCSIRVFGARINCGASASGAITATSTNPNYILARIGANSSTALLGTTPCILDLRIGVVTLPASNASWLVQAFGGSTVIINFCGNCVFGAGANGFQARQGSKIIWNASSITLTGADAGATCFDISDDSELIIPSTSTGNVFTGFTNTFKLGNKSEALVWNWTSGATTNDVDVEDESKFVTGTGVINHAAGNTGLKTRNGGKITLIVAGSPSLTNNANTAVDAGSAQQARADALGAYTATYTTGTIIVA